MAKVCMPIPERSMKFERKCAERNSDDLTLTYTHQFKLIRVQQ